MGLKYAATFYCPDMPAWKLSAASNPEFYSAADSDILLRCFTGIKADLEKQGRWSVFERHFVDLAQVLGRMSLRGVRVDQAKRQEAKAGFEARYTSTNADLQGLVPFEVRPRKVFKLSEESLRKKGSWIEGRMVKIVEKIPDDSPEALRIKKRQAKEEARLAKLMERARKKEAKATGPKNSATSAAKKPRRSTSAQPS